MSEPFETLQMTRGEWLDFRRSHVGGSDAAAVMGIAGAFRTPYQVWAEKTGLVVPEDISGVPRVEWGTRLESAVARKFTESHPELDAALPGDDVEVLVPRDRPWAMATLDGRVSNGIDEAVLEIKTAHYPGSKGWGESGTGAEGVPAHYLAQVNHYLSVTGWARAHVAVLIDGYDYREYVVERDPEDVAAVTQAVDRFWRDNVETRLAPAAVADDSTALLAAHPEGDGDYVEGGIGELTAIEEWREASERSARARREADRLAARLKSVIGDHAGLEFPEGRLTWSRYKTTRLDSKALRAEEPEVYERFARESASGRLNWKEAE